MQFHHLNWLPCHVTKKAKRAAQTFKGKTEIKPKSKSLNYAHAFLIMFGFCFCLLIPLHFNECIFYLFIFLLRNHWHLTYNYCVWNSEIRGCCDGFRKTCRSVRYVAYVMNSQTWKLHTSLACQKLWAYTIYYEWKKFSKFANITLN